MSIEIIVPSLNSVISLVEKAPAIAEKHIDLAIRRSLARVRGEINRESPYGVSQKHLRDAWVFEFARFEGTLKSEVPYAAAVEYGTRPHYVSPEQLAPWAQSKGLNPYAVSKSIAKKGTKANPFFQRAVNTATPGVLIEFDKAIQGIIKDMSF